VFLSGQWKVFTGNEIGSLFGWWAFTCHKRQHPELYPGMPQLKLNQGKFLFRG